MAAEKEKEKEKAASLYASSLFQNSPSPDDLPPPAFLERGRGDRSLSLVGLVGFSLSFFFIFFTLLSPGSGRRTHPTRLDTLLSLSLLFYRANLRLVPIVCPAFLRGGSEPRDLSI